MILRNNKHCKYVPLALNVAMCYLRFHGGTPCWVRSCPVHMRYQVTSLVIAHWVVGALLYHPKM